jgi:hypothetical protein
MFQPVIASKICSREFGLFRYGMLKSPSEHIFDHLLFFFLTGRKPSDRLSSPKSASISLVCPVFITDHYFNF